MRFEQHEQVEAPQALQQLEDAEIYELASALEQLKYLNLSAMLEDLANQDDAAVSQKNLDDLSQAFARHAALFPQSAEQLKAALEHIQLEWAETNKTRFHSREDYLQDLNASPQKFLKREGKKLVITQPGNSVRYTHINDFISPESKIIPAEDPSQYQLTSNGKIYTWSAELKTWACNGSRLKLLNAKEEIEIHQEPKAPSKEEVYDAVYEAVQPMVDAEGTTRGGFVQIRNHLFDGIDRPDPVPRAYYYYGQNFRLKPSVHLAYTGHTPERHKKVAKVIRESFINTLPGAGGGVPNREEVGLADLRDYTQISHEEQDEILDSSYKETIQITHKFYDDYPENNDRPLKDCISQKAHFDARLGALNIRLGQQNDEDTGNDVIGETHTDLYKNHVENVYQKALEYSKALNKLPRPLRKKILEVELIPKLGKLSNKLREEAPDQSKKIDHFISLLARSAEKPPPAPVSS